MKGFIRQELYSELLKSLAGEVNLIQAVVGPRQIGKTTLALQLFEKWKWPKHYATADEIIMPSSDWISHQWELIREKTKNKKLKSLLILDEVQKIPRWSHVVKKLFDEDRRKKYNIRVIILGSAALLMQRGLTESLAGRFEIHRHNHWSYTESGKFFKTSFNEYIYFGGYPVALSLRKDQNRWASYIRNSLIETVISKDVLLLSPITKPALLRQAFGLVINLPAQIVSYQKMLGTLQDAGNTTTIASYLQLLSKAFLLVPLERWSGTRIRQRGSTPKIIILDNGIVSSMSGYDFKQGIRNKVFWGSLVENAVGAQLYFLTSKLGGELFYWRDRDSEIDYILRLGNRLIAIEVKSGKPQKQIAAFIHFKRQYKLAESIVISNSKTETINSIRNIYLKDFFKYPDEILMRNDPA